MFIYRIESPDGNGFYQKGFFGYFPRVEQWWDNLDLCKWHEDDNKCAVSYFINRLHPHPSRDEALKPHINNENLHYAFASKKDLVRWFPMNIIKDVIKHKGKILKIEIEDQHVIKGKRQCMFNKEKVLNIIDITNNYR